MKRLAATVFIEGNRSFTTLSFRNHVYTGDPTNLVRVLNEMEADETEIVQRTFPDEQGLDLLRQISRQAFMPLTYMGGIESSEQATRIARIGFEKIGLSSAALKRPKLIDEVAAMLGASSTVLNLTYRESHDLQRAVVDWRSGKVIADMLSCVKALSSSNFGELKITNISRNGTFASPDLETIKSVSQAIPRPLTYEGGVSSVADITRAWEAGASCVSISSFLSLRSNLRSPLLLYPAIPYDQKRHA